jgi:hypothetical protein
MSTIQVTIPTSYQKLFDQSNPITINSLLQKLGFDPEILQELSYINEMKEDLKSGNFTVSE